MLCEYMVFHTADFCDYNLRLAFFLFFFFVLLGLNVDCSRHVRIVAHSTSVSCVLYI